MSNQHHCLRFRTHHASALGLFSKLFNDQSLVDVTLVCGNVKVRAHKAVLAAYSPYFRAIFEENPCQHPLVIFAGTCSSLLFSVLRFIYDGEVSVSEDKFSGFLALVHSLQIWDFERLELNQDSNSEMDIYGEVLKRKSFDSDAGDVRYEAVSIASLSSNPDGGPTCTYNMVNSETDHVQMQYPEISVCNLFTTDNVTSATGGNLDGHLGTKNMVNFEMDHDQIKPELISVGTIGTSAEVLSLTGGYLPDNSSGDRNQSLTTDLDSMFETPARSVVGLSPKRNQEKSLAGMSDLLTVPLMTAGELVADACGLVNPKDNPGAAKMYDGSSLLRSSNELKRDSSTHGPGATPSHSPHDILNPEAVHPLISFYHSHSIKEAYAMDGAVGSSDDPVNLSRTVSGSSGTNQANAPTPKFQRITPQEKMSILDLYLDEHLSYAEISRRLGMPEYKVQRCISRCRKEPLPVIPCASRGTPKKLGAEQETKLLDFIRTHKKNTQPGIQAYIKREFGVSLSINTVAKLLKVNAIKLARPLSKNCTVVAQNSLNTIMLRYEYALDLSRCQEVGKPLVFVDEGFIETKAATGLNVPSRHVLSALDKSGVLLIVSQKKSFSPEAVIEFLDQLRLVLPPTPHVFVMPDINLHQHDKVISWFRCTDHIQLFLPPRSPFLNPLQRMFRKLREDSGGMGAEEPHGNGQQLLESQVTAAECNEWIQETFHYIPLCLQKSPILHMHKSAVRASESSEPNMDGDRPSVIYPPNLLTGTTHETASLGSVEIVDVSE